MVPLVAALQTRTIPRNCAPGLARGCIIGKEGIIFGNRAGRRGVRAGRGLVGKRTQPDRRGVIRQDGGAETAAVGGVGSSLYDLLEGSLSIAVPVGKRP